MIKTICKVWLAIVGAVMVATATWIVGVLAVTAYQRPKDFLIGMSLLGIIVVFAAVTIVCEETVK